MEINQTKDCISYIVGDRCAKPYEIESFIAERCSDRLLAQALDYVSSKAQAPSGFVELPAVKGSSLRTDDLVRRFMALPSISKVFLLKICPNAITLFPRDLLSVYVAESDVNPCGYRSLFSDWPRDVEVYSALAVGKLIR